MSELAEPTSNPAAFCTAKTRCVAVHTGRACKIFRVGAEAQRKSYTATTRTPPTGPHPFRDGAILSIDEALAYAQLRATTRGDLRHD